MSNAATFLLLILMALVLKRSLLSTPATRSGIRDEPDDGDTLQARGAVPAPAQTARHPRQARMRAHSAKR